MVLVSPASAAVPAHGRAWELVTAGPTNGVNVPGGFAWSADGDRVAFISVGPMPGSPSGDLLATNLATRSSSGWNHVPIGEPITVSIPDIGLSGPLSVSADLRSWIWSSTEPLLPGGPPAPGLGLYRRSADGGLSLLGAVGSKDGFEFVAGSADVGHVVFQTTEHLLPADANRVSGGDAYELAGDQLRLVGVDSSGDALSTCGSKVGDGDPASSALAHAVSADGERIFFTAPASTDCALPQRVYVREHGTQTTEVSASHCTRLDCSAPQDATFAGATSDGAVAFVVTAQQLTDDDRDSSGDLYSVDLSGGSLMRLSAGPPGVDAGVSAPVRVSDDGARVYFVASGQLVPGKGVSGAPNLYLSDHGTVRFVASADGIDLRRAAISADGRTLAFATAARLHPDDTDSSVDVYRYDADADACTLVSHGDGSGGNSSFDVMFQVNNPIANALQADGIRYMSADGARILFVTSEPLVAEDRNATADVYEWLGGKVGLVSSGAGDASVAFGGLSADGRSAFFSTDETLVSADGNKGDQDLYDARVGGGFAVAQPPQSCQDDACQGPLPSRVVRPAPPTLDATRLASGLRIRAPSRKALKRLAHGGRAAIVVDVPRAGSVVLLVSARIHGRSTVVARAHALTRHAGRATLSVRLSPSARRALRLRHQLDLKLVLRMPQLGRAPLVEVTLWRQR